ncbi:MAG: 30S ribosomal protein S20 [Thermodesulfovibrionales bacterium]|nr:30S ribosomal protein S20 [Thermodesulfovibrionales bacterium]
MPPRSRPKKSPSGIKRARQNEKLKAKNKPVMTKLRTYRKKLLAAVESKEKDAVAGLLKEVAKVFMSAASKGVIKKNTASRNISRLSKLANSLLKPAAA